MERFTTRAAVYVLLEKDNKILMFKRKNTNWFDGFYNVPCGHIDGHETMVTAAVREVKEEVGVDIIPENLKFMQVVHRVSKNKDDYIEYVEAYFKVNKWQGEPYIAEEEFGEELNWFEINKLPENTLPYTKEAIQSVLKGDYYSEYGWKNE